MNAAPFTIERTYNAPAQAVWEALTDIRKIRQWYFNMDDFKPQPGFRFSFEGHNEGKTFVHLCEVTAVEPGKKLSYTWTYKGYPGASEVTFELFPEGDKTRVKLTHTGLETFPDIAEFKRSNFEMGWTQIIGTMLKEYVE
ncbi:MAG: SRPBCC domain-containing protein [Bacteroidetes bacterium]|nr:SRPBCC domain-containing protein [Bacteroidota bacterium]